MMTSSNNPKIDVFDPIETTKDMIGWRMLDDNSSHE